MTGELLDSGINALKDINNVVMNFSERDEENNSDVAQIQEDLKVLTNILHQVFLDMVDIDNIKKKIKIMDETLDKHLNRFID